MQEGELVDLSKIEKQVAAQAKLAQTLAKTRSELAAANYQSALQSVEQTGPSPRKPNCLPTKRRSCLLFAT